MRFIILTLTALSFSFCVQAQIKIKQPEQNYTFVDISFIDTDFDSGIELQGSFALDEQLSGIASLAVTDDLNIASVGAAYAVGIETGQADVQSLDIIAHGEVEFIDIDACVNTLVFGKVCSKNDDFGLLIGAEARLQLFTQLEIFADLSLRTTFDTDLPLSFGARFSVSEQLKAHARIEFSDIDLFALGARYQF